jgi:hypothetical protein
MQEVARVIDLWNQHQEMTLYVIKLSRTNYDGDGDHDNDIGGSDDESGTEGFESERDDPLMSTTGPSSSSSLDYAKIIEEYYHTKYDSTNMNNRRLIIMF